MTWYVAITNPNCHRRAEAELAALELRSFWPKYRKWASHARTKVAKEYPILGRYLFVEVPHGDFWSVRNVNGIEDLLRGDGGNYAPVPDAIVLGFMARYLAGEWDLIEKDTVEITDEETGEISTQRNRMPVGARIRIMEGEFADLLTVVRGYKRGKVKFLPPGGRNFVHTSAENVRAA